MKRIIIKPYIVAYLLCACSMGLAQDLLVRDNNDSINCKITNVTDYVIYFSLRQNDKDVEAHLTRDKVSDFIFGYFNSEKAGMASPDTAMSYMIETTDENIYVGQIIERNREFIVLRTNIGDITLKLINIKKLRPIDSRHVADPEASRWFDYLQSSRYFYSPTGYGLKKGDAYYQNVWVFFNQFSMGFSDYFSAGVGIVPLFLFGGAPTPVWVTPKFSIPVVEDQFNLGVGALLGGIIGEDDVDNSSFGVAYGIATLGDRDRNLSIGVGYGYTGGDFNQRPSISLSGMIKAGKKSYIVTENYIFDQEGLLSIGGRTLVKSATLDFGLVMPVNTGAFFGIPWLGMVLPIETKLGR